MKDKINAKSFGLGFLMTLLPCRLQKYFRFSNLISTYLSNDWILVSTINYSHLSINT